MWINRNVQITPFIIRSEIKTDPEGAGINVSKDTISRALYHIRLSFKITKKSAFTENQTCQRPIKVCRNKLFGRNSVTSVWRKNDTAFKRHNTIPTVCGWFHYDMGMLFVQCDNTPSAPTLHLLLGTISIFLAGDQLVVPIGASHIFS